MNNLTFENKLLTSNRLVQRALSEHDNPVIACSFGKNSMVVLHMVFQYKPDAIVLFNNTLVEYPDIYTYKASMCNQWDLNLLEIKPSKSFWWIVSNYGFPLYSRGGYKSASKMCCRYLKEYPIEKTLRKYKFDLYFTGLSRHESRLRELSARRYGNYFHVNRYDYWKCHPIMDWTIDDVWRYHYTYNIPKNPFYSRIVPDGFVLRTGCWCCTIPIKYGKVEFLRVNYPRLWRLLLNRGLAELILKKKIQEYVSSDQIDHLLEIIPCYFDRI